MIEIARRDHPGMRFDVGSMTDLAHPAGSVTGLLSWQTLIHAPDDDVLAILEQFRRVIRPGGALQLLFHVGDDSWLKTEGYGGHPMNVHVYRRQPRQMTAWLRDAAFEVDAQMLLGPGGKSAQAILFARRQP